MTYTRIDSFDITFPDCSARAELKVCERRQHVDGSKAKKGVGEKRLYCGADEKKLNSFFGFKNADDKQVFLILRDDLQKYYYSIKKEYQGKTSFKYKNKKELEKIYSTYQDKLKSLKKDFLQVEMKYRFDSQNRYYLYIDKRDKNRKEYYDHWDYVREICLPRVTRLLFMKLQDSSGGTVFYIKPFYTENLNSKGTIGCDSKARGGQAKYRNSVFDKYKQCVVTGVSNPKVLVACHILPYSECKESEEYNKYKYSEQNGLVMTPTIHKLFDLGYLSFSEEDGKIILSDYLFNNDRENLHLNESIAIDISNPDLKKCLVWHNEHIFLKASTMLDLKK